MNIIVNSVEEIELADPEGLCGIPRPTQRVKSCLRVTCPSWGGCEQDCEIPPPGKFFPGIHDIDVNPTPESLK